MKIVLLESLGIPAELLKSYADKLRVTPLPPMKRTPMRRCRSTVPKMRT